MRVILVAALCTFLSGCWFVYIPGSVMETLTGGGGNVCVADGAKVGDKIRMPGGGTGTLTDVHGGQSPRCRDPHPDQPYLATVKPD